MSKYLSARLPSSLPRAQFGTARPTAQEMMEAGLGPLLPEELTLVGERMYHGQTRNMQLERLV